MKLKSSITSNSVKLIDLYNKIISGSLITGPDFQRKLVWKKQHKYAFIETILLNFPFPEVYIASAEVDVNNLQTKEVVVDGQQRLAAIVDYIQGKGDFATQNKVIPFDKLLIDDKKDFLNYSVTVKDLKDIGDENIQEVFKRINSTDYSLNQNEILNAEYGGSEFAIFCKQLVDIGYNPTADETDIIIDLKLRNCIYNFFKSNNIFSDNDIKRMFDAQYIMLIVSTYLEGCYFSRSSKIEDYLEKYNESFEYYEEVLQLLEKSINIISQLRLPRNSYWFNKANLFTLLVELKTVNIDDLDLGHLEIKLLDLEEKMGLYFFNENEDDIKSLSQDETKYFEVARHGSHELPAREHRGKVIKKLIEDSLKSNIIVTEIDNQSENLDLLQKKGIQYSILIPTQTGLKKSIMDAVSGVRDFLKHEKIHDYEAQEYGPDHKKKISGVFVYPDKNNNTEISLYRSNGRGDYRIWFSDLREFVNPDDELALYIKDGIIHILNISRYNYSEIF